MNSLTQEYMLDHLQLLNEEEENEKVLKQKVVDPTGGEMVLVRDYDEYVVIIRNTKSGFYEELFISKNEEEAMRAYKHAVEEKL